MKRILASSFAVVVLTGIAPAQAQAPDDSIAYRKQVMGVIGNHMKSIANLVKGQVAYGDHLRVHASGLAATSRIALEAFEAEAPSGSKEKTTATAKVWAEWETFSEKMRTMQERAAALQEAAINGDGGQIGKAVQSLGGACKDCHDNFREK